MLQPLISKKAEGAYELSETGVERVLPSAGPCLRRNAIPASASCSARRVDPHRQAIGSVFRKGRLSQLLPAATMQLRPFGVVLTTVQVFLFSEA